MSQPRTQSWQWPSAPRQATFPEVLGGFGALGAANWLQQVVDEALDP